MLLLLFQSLSRGNEREQADAGSWLEMLFLVVGRGCVPMAGADIPCRESLGTEFI